MIEENRFRREEVAKWPRREVWESIFSQLSRQISLLVNEIYRERWLSKAKQSVRVSMAFDFRGGCVSQFQLKGKLMNSQND